MADRGSRPVTRDSPTGYPALVSDVTTTRLFGYALLDDEAEPDPDSGLYCEGAPGEAVDPRTIEPKKPGAKTPRSQRGPAPIASATP